MNNPFSSAISNVIRATELLSLLEGMLPNALPTITKNTFFSFITTGVEHNISD